MYKTMKIMGFQLPTFNWLAGFLNHPHSKKYPLIFRTRLQSYIQEREFVLFLNEILAAEVKKTPLPLRKREKTKLNHFQDTHLELIATRIIKMDNMDAIIGSNAVWEKPLMVAESEEAIPCAPKEVAIWWHVNTIG